MKLSGDPSTEDLNAGKLNGAKAPDDYLGLTAEGKLGEAVKKLDELKSEISRFNSLSRFAIKNHSSEVVKSEVVDGVS